MNKQKHDNVNYTQYRQDMLADIDVLAGEIGIRFAGTQGDERAAQYIAERFVQNGLSPELTSFRLLGWGLRENGRLEVRTSDAAPWQIECQPYVYSSSTSAEGFTGRIVYWGWQGSSSRLGKFRPFERAKFRFRKYALIDEHDVINAYVVSRDFPDAAFAAWGGMLQLPRTTPTVMIGELDGRRLEEMVASGANVEANLYVSAEFNPEAVTHNVVARLPGCDSRKSQEQILVSAHYDTQYTGPGAVDNASGVAGLLSLCRYFQEKRLKHSLIFAVYSGEEIGFLGAKHHLASLQESGEFSSIRAMVNLDMIACNEPNWIHASEDFLAQESVARATKAARIVEKYGSVEIVTPPWPSGDQDPFHDEGIPCVSFTWKGYKYAYTHTTEDTPDKVDAEVLADSFCLAHQVIDNIDCML